MKKMIKKIKELAEEFKKIDEEAKNKKIGIVCLRCYSPLLTTNCSMMISGTIICKKCGSVHTGSYRSSPGESNIRFKIDERHLTHIGKYWTEFIKNV